MSRGERKMMITRAHPDLSLSRQCQVLAISRSSFYYTPKGESAKNLTLMRRIDELFLKYPFYGSRQMVRHLRREGRRHKRSGLRLSHDFHREEPRQGDAFIGRTKTGIADPIEDLVGVDVVTTSDLRDRYAWNPRLRHNPTLLIVVPQSTFTPLHRHR